jgi:hypothetical protein
VGVILQEGWKRYRRAPFAGTGMSRHKGQGGGGEGVFSLLLMTTNELTWLRQNQFILKNSHSDQSRGTNPRCQI